MEAWGSLDYIKAMYDTIILGRQHGLETANMDRFVELVDQYDAAALAEHHTKEHDAFILGWLQGIIYMEIQSLEMSEFESINQRHKLT